MSILLESIWRKFDCLFKSEEKLVIWRKKVIFSSLFSIILRPTVTADRIIEVISK